MNDLLKVFPKGSIINKSISKDFGKIPKYVSDYLISQLVNPEDPSAGILKIHQILEEHYVESNKKELIKSKIKESGKHSLLGNLSVRLDESKNEYFATINVLENNTIRIHKSVLERFGEILLVGGCFGSMVVCYDPNSLIKKRNYPFVVIDFTPLKVTQINLESFINNRNNFSFDKWLDLIINSIGIDPSVLSFDEKMIYIYRLMPFIESNLNLIELGGVETGKTFFYRGLSNYSFVLSGSQTTVASLFYNKLRRKVGLLGQKDVVAFDEISHSKFGQQDLTDILKDYMGNGRFGRDNFDFSSDCSLIFLGNIDTERDTKTVKNYYQHLFKPLPSSINSDRAFLDRIHGFIPGWVAPQISESLMSKEDAFSADYLAEIFHRLRNKDYNHIITSRVVFDKIGQRNQVAITKMVSAMIKILFPFSINNDELKLIMDRAIELRQRVIDQLAIINPGEFKGNKIEYNIKG
jgi:ATP-dependent Lon protease